MSGAACGECHACELGDPAMCYGCPTHGAWCGSKCNSDRSCILCGKPITSEQRTAAWVIADGAHLTCIQQVAG
jgi:hypothetical protein